MRINSWTERFKCFLGWHSWRWTVSEHGWGKNGNPPNGATCYYCGIKYKD